MFCEAACEAPRRTISWEEKRGAIVVAAGQQGRKNPRLKRGDAISQAGLANSESNSSWG
jgi:hypothetical protein